MPKRIQMSRQHPWKAENPDAIIVDRRTVYGNPFKIGVEMMVGTVSGNLLDQSLAYDTVTPKDRAEATDLFRGCLSSPRKVTPMKITRDGDAVTLWSFQMPTDEQVAKLAGHDLACWCPLDEPCHADVWLAIANHVPALELTQGLALDE